MQYQKPFFKASSKKTEEKYGLGIYFLEKKDYEKAYENFSAAAKEGHVSAYYNLYLMISSGITKYFDIDLAAEYLNMAANEGHPTAKSTVKYLEAADSAGIGYDNIINTCIEMGVPPAGLQPWLMLVTTRFTRAICKKFNATTDFLLISLYFMDNDKWFNRYFREFDIPFGCYFGGIDLSGNGGAGAQINNYIHQLALALRNVGYPEEYVKAARYTIVGYVLNNSELISSPVRLAGLSDFIEILNSDENENEDEDEDEDDFFGFRINK